MNRKDLYQSMNQIDDEILERSEVRKKKKFSVWMKWGAVAACLCLVITASMVMPRVLNTKEENSDKISRQGTTVNSSMGKIILTENNQAESKCTFLLTKSNNESIYFCFRGFTVLSTYVDENDIQRKEVQQYHIITPYDKYDEAATNHIVLDDKLLITVNGEVVETIPIKQGTYEITIDYGALYEFLDHIEPAVDVYSFGSFDIADDFPID